MSDVLGTERVGQLTGRIRSTLDQPTVTTDWMYWPLLNETGCWGVDGVDLGANAEHDGRLFVFFGDVAVNYDNPDLVDTDVVRWKDNPDLVCWTTDTKVQRHGGHLALGWDFRLPNDHQGATQITGQWQWRLCANCHGIFFCPEQVDVGVCPAGGAHAPIGWNFVLPNDHQGATELTGQQDWRPCDRCRGLFWAPREDASKTVCPAGGPHRVPPGSWVFFLPALETGASDTTGQPQWRFCANCHSLFWNGDSIKGVCPAALGGGFRLNGVLDRPDRFAPFLVDPPIGQLGPFETPTGAFSHACRAYVFVWVGKRPGDAPTPGSYLTSKPDPTAPGTYRVEQLISPLDLTRTSFSQVAPVCVDNAAFPGLFPASSGTGLIMFGQGYNVRLGDDAIHLAWSPLGANPWSPLGANPGVGPLSMWYYTGNSNGQWSREANKAMPLLRRHGYTSVSAAWLPWLPGPCQWILIYGTANPIQEGGPVDGPIMARLGRSPFELANVPDIEIFHPGREHAYGNYMHQPGLDRINPDMPPAQPRPLGNLGWARLDNPGWAYGAYLLNRFTYWNQHAGLIELYYLMSTASPYQVHLMHTTIRFG
jgi:hypothetical protein